MECPLHNLITQYGNEQAGMDTLSCLQEECAWWDGDVLACSVKDIAKTAREIQRVLGATALIIQELSKK